MKRILAITLLVCVAVIVIIGWRAEGVKHRESAGSIMHGDFKQGGIFTPDTTALETTLGIYQVEGILQINKGQGLVKQTRINGDEYLCYGDDRCWKLM